MEFVANNQYTQEMADQQTDYVNHVFHNDNNGFLKLYTIFKDALTVRYGASKWWTEHSRETYVNDYSNQAPEVIDLILQEAEVTGVDAQVIEEYPNPDGTMNVSIQFTEYGNPQVK